MNGVVVGGWEFVIAAYAVTGLALFGYAIWLVRKYRSGQ
jgi:CcmD family protein